MRQADKVVAMHNDSAWNVILEQVVSDDTFKCSTSVIGRSHHSYIKLLMRP